MGRRSREKNKLRVSEERERFLGVTNFNTEEHARTVLVFFFVFFFDEIGGTKYRLSHTVHIRYNDIAGLFAVSTRGFLKSRSRKNQSERKKNERTITSLFLGTVFARYFTAQKRRVNNNENKF